MSQNSPAQNAVRSLRLGIDLTDAGAHSTVWRQAGVQKAQPFDIDQFLKYLESAQRATFDFAVIGDGFSLQPGGNSAYQGRVDSVLIAARVAPVTAGIGLVPSINVNHTEPFHVSKLVATLDHVSKGRAGWEPTVSLSAAEAKLFGRKEAQTEDAAWGEATEVAEVVRKLWDSWEDDAEIRDQATARFIDRDKLHYVDYEGINFKVKGPSITPRPIQGHPVTVLSIPTDIRQQALAIELAAAQADVVRIQVSDGEQAQALRTSIKTRAAELGRNPDTISVVADIFVVTGDSASTAEIRYDILRDLEPIQTAGQHDSALKHIGTPGELARFVAQWFTDSVVDGFVLRPAALHTDLREIVAGTITKLQARGLFHREYAGATFRENLGLERPQNEYAVARELLNAHQANASA